VPWSGGFSLLGEHILDVTIAQSKTEIELDGPLDDDAWKPFCAELSQTARIFVRQSGL